jgi:hypothetical protein
MYLYHVLTYTHLYNSRGGGKKGGGARDGKVVKSLNKIYEEGGIMQQDINKRGGEEQNLKEKRLLIY